MNFNNLVKVVSLRQSSACRRREISASRSEAGQFVGHADEAGHSSADLKGFSPSTKKVDSVVLQTRVRLRAPIGGFLSSLASIAPQSYIATIPRVEAMKLMTNSSCLAKNN